MKTKTGYLLLFVMIVLLACRSTETPLVPAAGQAPEPFPTEAVAPATMEASAADSMLPATEQVVQPPPQQAADEAILILEPGPGSRLTSPLHLAGQADSTFEQTLLVRVLRPDGSLLLAQPVQINAELGTRGPFAADLAFSVSGEENVLVQVLDLSARDGGIVHLASVGVMLLASGPQDLRPAGPAPEQLQIFSPVPGDVITGGLVLVQGYGAASFENTLVVEVYDADGQRVGFASCMTDAAEPGTPGYFSVEVGYNVSVEGPGRIAVVDALPVFDGLGHVTSVPVTLAP